ncbi:MAG TPA: hypothetical protein VK752_14285 [Bryobacteraceae bacterium]|jgi:hypothetical protein|nr:hypothetical protein [Bryobacteraceae bacterium]
MLKYIAIAFLIGTVCGQSPQGIPWDQHSPLSWDDFKGHARRHAGETSAETDTGFRVQLECREGHLDIRVAAEFYKTSSWVKAGRRSAELLRHEQGHFDITELYARKMRKAIREAKIGCADDRQAEAAGKKIFEEIDREWEGAEKRYDVETGDGTDWVKQKEALERIGREMGELSAYRL